MGNDWKVCLPILLVGMTAIGLYGYSQRPKTPIAWQNQDEQYLGNTYTLELASDGCYWRTYMRKGTDRVHQRIDIINDGQGGKENCPYRK